MRARQIPEWAIATALCGVLVIGAVDLYLMRRHPVKPHPRTQSELIGLHAEGEGDAVRLQWNRQARPIVNADRAVLHITDGAQQRHLMISGAQLDSSSVRYWPESDQVTYRIEVFHGDQHVSDTTASSTTRTRKGGRAGLAEIQKLRPSPFEQVQPEIVVVQYRPQSVVRPREVAVETVQWEEDNTFGRVISKIPLLRRLRKHQESGESPIPRIPR